ncbi:hypothetical protein ACFSTD_17200 [Novosphingobium colocasiae]
MIRALDQVIMPALDPNNSLAREQAGLLAGHLRLLAAQWNRTENYARTCLDDLVQSLEGFEPAGGPHTAKAFDAVARTIAARSPNGIEQQYKQLSAVADALVRAVDIDGDAALRQQLHRALLAFSRRQALRDRSWFALSGFDLKPDELIPIEKLAPERPL